jgi:AcrR family transcriptional regulator
VRTPTGTGPARRGTPTLTAADWAEGALQLIADKGLPALTVSARAGRLGVTKGSFYWHFEGRSDLLAAALHRWEARATTEAIHGLEAVADPRRRLELMLDAASQLPRSRSLYAALAEAAEDPVVRRVLNRVAAARLAYLEVCYIKLGLPPQLAKMYSVLAYSAYRGLLQLAHEAPDALPTDWSTYPEQVRRSLMPPASAAALTRRAAPERKRTRSRTGRRTT